MRLGVVRAGLQLRAIEIDGEPWLMAADVCKALGLGNMSEACASLDADERNTLSIADENNGMGLGSIPFARSTSPAWHAPLHCGVPSARRRPREAALLIAIDPLPLAELPSQPRVSIVITSYNYARFLGECLEACLGQSRPPDEIVVVDDGSTDNTWDLLSDYMARHPQVRGIRRVNGGMCASTNTGIAAATGDVVLLLDADDLPAKNRVEGVLAALQRPVDGRVAGWAHHPLRRFSETHDDLGLTPHYHAAPAGWLGPQVLARSQSPVATMTSGLAFRRELLEAIGPIADDRSLAQDMQYWVAAALLSPVAWIAEPLGRYRAHGVSDSVGGMLSTLPKVKLTRQRVEHVDAWLRRLLERLRPEALPFWRKLDEQPGYNWLRFLEGWLAGSGRDFGLLMKVLRHPDTRAAPLQQRVYLYSSTCLPQSWFTAFSRFVFGASPLKAFVRRSLGRG